MAITISPESYYGTLDGKSRIRDMLRTGEAFNLGRFIFYMQTSYRTGITTWSIIWLYHQHAQEIVQNPDAEIDEEIQKRIWEALGLRERAKHVSFDAGTIRPDQSSFVRKERGLREQYHETVRDIVIDLIRDNL